MKAFDEKSFWLVDYNLFFIFVKRVSTYYYTILIKKVVERT